MPREREERVDAHIHMFTHMMMNRQEGQGNAFSLIKESNRSRVCAIIRVFNEIFVMSIRQEIHLLPLNDTYKSVEESDCSDSEDDVEVASTFDTEENDLIDMSAYLNIDSSEESDDNGDNPSTSALALESASSGCDSENDENPAAGACVSASDMTVSSTLSPSTTLATNNAILTNTSVTPKRKRRQWSVAEKLRVLMAYESSKSKHRTAIEHGCTTAQIRKWERSKVEMTNLIKSKKGKNWLHVSLILIII